MKKIISSIALIGLALTLVGCGGNSWSTWSNGSASAPAGQQVDVALNPTAKAVGYNDYSPESVKLAVAEGKKTAVFFHGATCGSCAKLDANITENAASIPEDVAIFKADWDSNQELAKEYKVDKYHTVSFLSDGAPKNVKGLFEVKDLVAEFDKPAPQAAAPAAKVVAKVASYTDYSASAVKAAMDEWKKTAVFFHGATCGSCAKLDANITANAGSIPADVAIFKADWDSNQELAKEYKVDKYHTVSILSDGEPKNVKGLFEVKDLIAEM